LHVHACRSAAAGLGNLLRSQVPAGNPEEVRFEAHTEDGGVWVVAAARKRATAKRRIDVDMAICDELRAGAHGGQNDEVPARRVDNLPAPDRLKHGQRRDMRFRGSGSAGVVLAATRSAGARGPHQGRL